MIAMAYTDTRTRIRLTTQLESMSCSWRLMGVDCLKQPASGLLHQVYVPNLVFRLLVLLPGLVALIQ